MKVNTNLIVQAIEERKAYLQLLVEGQMNDLDEKAAEFTRTVIVGLDEALDLIFIASISKGVLRRAGRLLSADLDENLLRKMILAIIKDYRLPEDDRESVIDNIDEVEVWENMGWKLNSEDFLKQIDYI